MWDCGDLVFLVRIQGETIGRKEDTWAYNAWFVNDIAARVGISPGTAEKWPAAER